MSNDYFEVPVNITFICPVCNKEIPHNYTQEDLLNNEYLEFTCKCGYTEKVSTSGLIKDAKEEVIKQLKKTFKTI
jgi:hypothetical protein